jgi:hypothetical protein
MLNEDLLKINNQLYCIKGYFPHLGFKHDKSYLQAGFFYIDFRKEAVQLLIIIDVLRWDYRKD